MAVFKNILMIQLLKLKLIDRMLFIRLTVPLKCGKFATKYLWIYGYFLQCTRHSSFACRCGEIPTVTSLSLYIRIKSRFFTPRDFRTKIWPYLGNITRVVPCLKPNNQFRPPDTATRHNSLRHRAGGGVNLL